MILAWYLGKQQKVIHLPPPPSQWPGHFKKNFFAASLNQIVNQNMLHTYEGKCDLSRTDSDL